LKKYVIKRLLIIIPTLWIISLIAFALSKFVPQDPVTILLGNRGVAYNSTQAYNSLYHELELQKPNFYFAILPHYYPKNINDISDPIIKSDVKEALKAGYHYNHIKSYLENNTYSKTELVSQLDESTAIKKTMYYWPKLIWYGIDNQYHNWISTFFNGASLVDGKPALNKVLNALQWTLSITLVDFMLSIFLCIFLGKYLIVNIKKKRTHWISNILYAIYSIPIFWMATIAVIYFTTDDYGSWTNIFPSVGINIHPGHSTIYQILHNIPKLILPILCLTLHSLAYTTRFMRRSLREELNKPYIATAYSKGLNRKEIINKHAFRNALTPMITLFVAAFANAFAGSLLIEVIFNIPGIGRLLFNTLAQADWNVVFCIVLVLSFVTTIVYLLGDIFYALAQPKLRYDI